MLRVGEVFCLHGKDLRLFFHVVLSSLLLFACLYSVALYSERLRCRCRCTLVSEKSVLRRPVFSLPASCNMEVVSLEQL